MKRLIFVGSLAMLMTGCFNNSSSDNSFNKGPITPPKTSNFNCPSNIECKFLAVPKDYNDLSKGTVKVHYGIQKAKVPSERIGVLIFNFGGPGGEAVLSAGSMASRYLPKAITDKFDIIGIDPRGSGQSAFAKELLDCSNSIAGDCSKEYKEFARYIGTNSLIQDIDRLRQELGEEKINFLGYSYGTRVGALYSEKYPQRIRTLILDAPMPPNSQNAIDLFRDGAAGKDVIAQYRLKTAARKAQLEMVIEQINTNGSYDDSHGNTITLHHIRPFLYQYLAARDNAVAWKRVEQAAFTFLDNDDATELFGQISTTQNFAVELGFNNQENQNRFNALFKAVVCTDEIAPINKNDIDNAKAII